MSSLSSLRCAAIVIAALKCVPACAINVCTDAEGKTVYQDQACLSVAPNARNQPVAAQVLTAPLVLETVRRFQAAMSARDVTTAGQFLTPNFKATITTESGTERYTRTTFIRLMTDVLNAATSYESVARCGDVSIGSGEAVIRCELKERMVLLKRQAGGDSTSEYRVVSSGGRVLLSTNESKAH
jgi:hypothetical protein